MLNDCKALIGINTIGLYDVFAPFCYSMCDLHEEAVKKYQSISPLIQFSDIVGLAVALYKMNDFSASYQGETDDIISLEEKNCYSCYINIHMWLSRY